MQQPTYVYQTYIRVTTCRRFVKRNSKVFFFPQEAQPNCLSSQQWCFWWLKFKLDMQVSVTKNIPPNVARKITWVNSSTQENISETVSLTLYSDHSDGNGLSGPFVAEPLALLQKGTDCIQTWKAIKYSFSHREHFWGEEDMLISHAVKTSLCLLDKACLNPPSQLKISNSKTFSASHLSPCSISK